MRIITLFFMIFPFMASANVLPLDDALRATYTACVGIDDELADLKTMAGINTAITAVGTATGASATIVGVVKASTDQQIAELEKILAELAEHTKNLEPMTEEEIVAYMAAFDAAYGTKTEGKDTIDSELDALKKKSKTLGNWRTGLMAGTTATNVAGAVIAGTNQVKGDLETQIVLCKDSVDQLRKAIMQARINGEDITEAQTIADVCGEYEYADLSKINTRAKGAAISAGIGAVTGLAGTITSATANTDKTRENKEKEKNLNLAANILAGTTTAASATATVFNATQIKAIKQVAEIAANCTGVLK